MCVFENEFPLHAYMYSCMRAAISQTLTVMGPTLETSWIIAMLFVSCTTAQTPPHLEQLQLCL